MLNEFMLRGVVNIYDKDLDIYMTIQLDTRGIEEFITVYIPFEVNKDFEKLGVSVGDTVQVSGHVRKAPQLIYNRLHVEKLLYVVKKEAI